MNRQSFSFIMLTLCNHIYILILMVEYTQIKVKKSCHENLKKLAMFEERSMASIVDRLVRKELEIINEQSTDNKRR